MFYVQRLMNLLPSQKPKPDEWTVGNFFRVDYMGSAEFEFGALGKALRFWNNNASDPKLVKVSNGTDTHRIWVVGVDDAAVQDATAFVENEFSGKNSCKERTQMFASGYWSISPESVEKTTGWVNVGAGSSCDRYHSFSPETPKDVKWTRSFQSKSGVNHVMRDGDEKQLWAAFRKKDDAVMFSKIVTNYGAG